MQVISETIASPQRVDGLGIRQSLCEDLALRVLYLEGEMSLLELANRIHLSLAVVEEIFDHLRKVQLCEVKGMNGTVRRIAPSLLGKARALELLSISHYAGAAPVSLEDYTRQVRAQSVRDAEVRPVRVERALSGLVLRDDIISQLGTAVVSGRSIILYGPPGTGKTAIAECLPRIYGDEVWIPYAVEVDNQIITVYDSHIHEACDGPEMRDADHRWILCKRPRVVVGGELTVEMLDLQANPLSKFYSAPLQMKANNGVLIVDDFGRQRMRPEDLLNRWIVPLDRRIDFLTLMGGKKFEIPFDLFVVFASNLSLADLADEAFLRRIQTKIKIDYVSVDFFRQICARVCQEYGLAYTPEAIEGFIGLLARLQQPLRACYPRDIVLSITWSARYEDRQPQFDSESVRRACHSYFMGA